MIPDGTKYVTGTVTIKPTTAYVGDNTDGKLTLYVPYYGVTGIGQITLSASGAGNVQIKNMHIINKSATDTQVEVNFTLDEGDAEDVEGSLPMVIDGAFDMSKVTVNDNNEIVAGNGFSESTGSATWLRPSGGYTRNGNTYTQTISLDINKSTQSSRSGAVVVYSPSGREVTRFVVNQSAAEGKDVNNEIFDATILGDNESANCYTISSPGRYELKPYKGAYRGTDYVNAEKCSGKPVLIASDNPNINIVFCEPDRVSQRILFDVNPTISNGKVTGHKVFNAGGNVVIGLQNDKGEILWSWHLWFNTQVLGIGNQYDQKYSTKATLMDRNIGASVGAGSGVYYQWGKHEPFFENKSDLATVVKGVKGYHGAGTSNYSWSGDTKQVSDPCPPGYKVPHTGVWRRPSYDAYWLPEYLQYELSPLVTYPYSSRVSDNQIVEQYTNTSKEKSETFLYVVKYTYVTESEKVVGGCWSSTANMYLYYGYMHETNILKSIGGYSLDKLPSRLTKYLESIASDLSKLDKSQVYYDILETDSSNKDDGYQVRCMLIEE